VKPLLIFACAAALVAIGPLQFNSASQASKGKAQHSDKPPEPPPSFVDRAEPPKPETYSAEVTGEGKPKPVRITELPPNDRWYKAYVITTMILVGVGIVGVVMAYRTLKAIERQGRAMMNSERAWVVVTISKTSLPRMWGATDPWLKLRPVLTNHGKTTARIIRVVARWEAIRQDKPGIPAQLPTTPAYADDASIWKLEISLILPPNAPGQPMTVWIPARDLQRAKAGVHSLYVHGFVEYRDTVKDELHRTRFCYIWWEDPPGFTIAGITPPAYLEAT
jgi:hypothetical protein